MADKIKLFLTRNHLFEFDNCLCFKGVYENGFEKEQFLKSLKMLYASYPLLSAAVELCESGEAYAVLGETEAKADFWQGDENELVKKIVNDGVDFEKNLFSFYVLNEKTLLVCGHCLAADLRSLMLLAADLMAFYEKKRVSINVFEPVLFSEVFSVPSNVMSPVVDSITSGLEFDWKKKTRTFNSVDYRRARGKYFSEKSAEKFLKYPLCDGDYALLKAYCKKSGTDASSVVAYCFYDAMNKVLKGKRKYKKITVTANERVFFEDFEKYSVGPFSGSVSVVLKKKKLSEDSLEGRVKCYHDEIYENLINSSRVFYYDFFHAKLSPFFCDSAYMFGAGLLNFKSSKRLARIYGCANDVMGRFSSYNLDQQYWNGLSAFVDVKVFEPLRLRESSAITFFVNRGKAEIDFAFKVSEISGKQGEIILENAIKTLEKIIEN